MHFRQIPFFVLACCLAGCTSTKTSNTVRTGTEQLLISNAIDQSLSRVDFSPLSKKKVLVEDKYLECVDKNYITSSVRHRVLSAGGELAIKPEEADVLLEIRSGGVGTDISDSYVGMPGLQIPGAIALPDVKLMTRTRQSAYAKIGLVAVDAKTKKVLGDGGVSLAMSDDNNWFFMGVGPYQDGSLKREVIRSVGANDTLSTLIPDAVSFHSPDIQEFDESQKIELAAGEEKDEPSRSKVNEEERSK